MFGTDMGAEALKNISGLGMLAFHFRVRSINPLHSFET